MTGSEVATIGEMRQTTALVRPIVTPAALVEQHKLVSDLIAQALEKGKDYGVIPGTGDKPTLLKPGAERLCIAFGAVADYEEVEHEADHERKVSWSKRKKVWRNAHPGDKSFSWAEESGESTGLYHYVVKCRVVQRDTGIVLATGLGSCSTMESKYIDRPRECENTVLKMAQKRAFIAATLNAFGLSDRFTQDVEDLHGEQSPPPPPAAAAPVDHNIVPFGKDKGKSIADCTYEHITSMKEWAEGKNPTRFADFIKACAAELRKREEAGDAQEPAGAAA